MSLNLKDNNGNTVTSFSIGNDGIVYGFIGNPNTGYPTVSLNQESCNLLNFTYSNDTCNWRSDIYNNTIITNTFNSVLPIKFKPNDMGKDLKLTYDYVINIKVNELEDPTLLGEMLKQVKINIIIGESNTNNIVYEKNIFDGDNLLEHLTDSIGLHLSDYSNIQTHINNIQMTLGSAITPSKLLELWTTNEEYIDEIGNDLQVEINKEYAIGYKITNYFKGLHLKLDNILVESKHNYTKRHVRRYTKNVSFEFERHIDNKKVWSFDEYERRREDESHSMQYTIEHEGEVLNTKELELALAPNELLVNEFWKTVLSNKNRLSGLPYNGMGNSIPLHTRLDGVGFDEINTLEEFKTLIFERLTNPITLRGVNHYNALQTLNNRLRYRFLKYNEYSYENSMEVTRKIDKYWLDIVEEFVPSTSIWGSSIKISNNLFQDNKFIYKNFNITSNTTSNHQFDVDIEYISFEPLTDDRLMDGETTINNTEYQTITDKTLQITNIVNNLKGSVYTMNYGGIQETILN